MHEFDLQYTLFVPTDLYVAVCGLKTILPSILRMNNNFYAYLLQNASDKNRYISVALPIGHFIGLIKVKFLLLNILNNNYISGGYYRGKY